VVHSLSCPLRMGRVQRLLVGSLYLVKIVLPLKLTQHFSSSKMTSHPALHRTHMPSKDAIFMSGTICPISLCGRPGMSTSHMCVDTIFLPSGRLMCMGFVAMRMLSGGGTSHYENRCGASVSHRICWRNSHRVCVVFDCTGTVRGDNRGIVVIFGTVCQSKAKLIWGGVR
jgi:hypothetical protein